MWITTQFWWSMLAWTHCINMYIVSQNLRQHVTLRWLRHRCFAPALATISANCSPSAPPCALSAPPCSLCSLMLSTCSLSAPLCSLVANLCRCYLATLNKSWHGADNGSLAHHSIRLCLCILLSRPSSSPALFMTSSVFSSCRSLCTILPSQLLLLITLSALSSINSL